MDTKGLFYIPEKREEIKTLELSGGNMRREVRQFIYTIQNLKNEDIRSFSKILAQELYNMDKNMRDYLNMGDDFIGQVKNDLQWIMMGVEEAEKRQAKTQDLGHSINLPPHLLLEEIEEENIKKYLLTENPTLYKHRITLGIFDNLNTVKLYVDNNC